ncbi:hypothetical protein FisN_29Lu093 [Fistulifera solaris]|uniref:tRNA (guanine(46)-N(7))-methyltransferase n=1 Tax=Fistulifera solaris TaxID=1519565 RepID=A0A1Z5JLL8_FISSO|nr:hypothetical protein FisN_29Lu093 [Fistulifera solaris]|eukprot:GAX14879.1 hypothetical protein FisN_29Lu093 [Fistulifera solaris]
MMFKSLGITLLTMASRSRSSRGLSTEYTITCPSMESETLRNEVHKHCDSLDLFLTRKPVSIHSLTAFSELGRQLPSDNAPLILDSGCGTGRSSLRLGELYPESHVIGVDRSIARLSRHIRPDRLVEQVSDNVWLVRAELVDFWRCCRDQQWSFVRHYLLYPNPYPKKVRYKSRWYAHPCFPLLLQLPASEIIVRSNWLQYLEDFRDAVDIAADYNKEFSIFQTSNVERLIPSGQDALTNFEQKYWNAGEATYELVLTAKTADV